jgi:hypothetical protein
MFLYQPETNTAANGMSSMEEAKWRYWDEDPALLGSTLDSLEYLRAEQERERQQALTEAQRPLSVDVARLTEATTEFRHHPGTLAVQVSFERR